MHLLLVAPLLLGLFPQAPNRDALQDAAAEAADPQPLRGLQEQSDWLKLSRLVGGEWNASGEGAPARFHRFWFGPGERSIWAHTRDATKLTVWPESESIYYWHPGEETLKVIAVAPKTLFDGTLTWEGDQLTKDFVYRVGSQSLDFLSKWAFEGGRAYDWKLFRKTKKGLAEQGGMRFEHSSELRPLPEVAPPQLKPIEQLAFLAPFLGPWDGMFLDQEGRATDDPRLRVIYSWAAGGNAMLVETMQAGDDGQSTAKGMVYWHLGHKEVRYVEALGQGEVREGSAFTVKAEEGDDMIEFALQSWSPDSHRSLNVRWAHKDGQATGRIETTLPGEDPRYRWLFLKRPQ